MGFDNPLHIAFLLVILLLVFGAKRLPEIGRSIGSGMREFKDSISGESTPVLSQSTQQPPAPTQPVAAQPVAAPVAAQPVAAPVPTQAAAPAQPAQAPAEPTHQT